MSAHVGYRAIRTLTPWLACAALALPGCAVEDAAIDGARDGAEPLETITWHVRPGDTLHGLDLRLAAEGDWRSIARENGLADPDRLAPGQPVRLRVPASVARALGPLPRPFPHPIAPAPICPTTDLPPAPAEGPEPPGVRTVCRASAAARVCLRSDFDGAREAAELMVREAGGVQRVAVPPPVYYGGGGLSAGHVDLDGDGLPELAVAVHLSTSNGIALANHHVVIFDGRDRAARLSFETFGWGVAAALPDGSPPDEPADDGALPPGASLAGLFVRPVAGEARCAVAPADFEGLDDPVLAAGNYEVQRLYAYRQGALDAAPIDIRARRLRRGAPLERRMAEAPPWGLEPDPPVAATLLAIDGGPWEREARLRLAGGAEVTVELSRLALSGGMRYPRGYRPADPGAFVGRPVEVYCPPDSGALGPEDRCAVHFTGPG